MISRQAVANLADFHLPMLDLFLVVDDVNVLAILIGGDRFSRE